jgi:hypothetical protein
LNQPSRGYLLTPLCNIFICYKIIKSNLNYDYKQKGFMSRTKLFLKNWIMML